MITQIVLMLRLKGFAWGLDIDFRHGRWAEALGGQVSKCVGIDFSAELLWLARVEKLPFDHF